MGFLAAAAVTLAVVLGGLGVGSAPASSNDGFAYGWGRLHYRCVHAKEGLIFAHVSTTMWVHNRGQGSHWVTNMRLKARLVSPEAGIKNRSWHTNRFPVSSELLQDYNYSHAMAVNTDHESPYADYLLEVKEVWDRKIPWHDIVRHLVFHFSCPDEEATALGRTAAGGY